MSYYRHLIMSFDADALAFISAASITDNNQKNAINTLVINLKNFGIWSKMKAMYPIVGGNATAHKFNLKDPRDLDVAFRLSFVGGWTHSANGMTPNGTTGYAETFCVPSTYLINNNSHLSFYSRTNSVAVAKCDFGVQDDQGGTVKTMFLNFYNTLTSTIGYIQNTDARRVVFTPEVNSLGLLLISRTSSTSLKLYRNSVLKATQTLVSGSMALISPVIGALKYRNLSVISYLNHSIRECAFATIGDGLSDTETANLYNEIQQFQTTLGRQV
jgi:hypothetical protein